jgi:hypothetical protein
LMISSIPMPFKSPTEIPITGPFFTLIASTFVQSVKVQ